MFIIQVFEILDLKVGTSHIAKLASSQQAYERELSNLQRFQGLNSKYMFQLDLRNLLYVGFVFIYVFYVVVFSCNRLI